jgi:signal transduction histidine kinase
LIRGVSAELAKLKNPRTLMFGVVGGYILVASAAVLMWIAIATDTMPWHWMLGALLGAKLVTNTLTYVAVRFERGALGASAVNTVMDIALMTGVIWATGDIESPIIAIYTIEITVVALLTNVTTTVLVSIVAMVVYVGMALLVMADVIPHYATPAQWSGRSAAYLALAIGFTGFAIAAPAAYTVALLRRLRERERALEAKTNALVEANKQKAQFTANVTHELRTPLQGIMGLSDLVAKWIYGETTEKQRQAMGDIKGSAKKLHALINDLLQLSSHDAGKVHLNIETVDIEKLATSTVASTQWLLAGKQLEVTVNVASDVPQIRTDRTKLTQILVNLLSNAIKFTPDGGSVTLHVAPMQNGVELTVADTGIGIPAAAVPHVFDEFYQVDGSPMREHGGVGLGLALVKRLALALGGSVTVESEVDRGSRFRVRLPRKSRGGTEGEAGQLLAG